MSQRTTDLSNTVTRRVGRPRKTNNIITNDIIKKAGRSTDIVSSKRVGRPRKNAKKVGRPRKAIETPITKFDTPRKPGRPRKTDVKMVNPAVNKLTLKPSADGNIIVKVDNRLANLGTPNIRKTVIKLLNNTLKDIRATNKQMRNLEAKEKSSVYFKHLIENEILKKSDISCKSVDVEYKPDAKNKGRIKCTSFKISDSDADKIHHLLTEFDNRFKRIQGYKNTKYYQLNKSVIGIIKGNRNQKEIILQEERPLIQSRNQGFYSYSYAK